MSSYMDYFGHFVALGFDAILFGVVSKIYSNKRKALKAIEDVPVYNSSTRSLKKYANKIPGSTIPYVAIRGVAKALGSPIQSLNVRDTFGVIQKLTIKEHVAARGTFGFWREYEKTIQETTNVVPFVLQVGKSNVEIVDPLAADFLDLETISDTFEQRSPGFMDYMWSYIMGTHQRGLQNTEEMIREGSLLTAIGEVTLAEDGQMLRMQPPSNGLPFFLTSLPLSTLSRRLEEEKRFYKFLTVILGVAGIALAGAIAMKWYAKKEELRKKEERRKELQRTRRERRGNVRSAEKDLPESQLCVVCRTNPREVIVLPCGHVCLCEDCSENVKDYCPLCRADIQTKSPAYL